MNRNLWKRNALLSYVAIVIVVILAICLSPLANADPTSDDKPKDPTPTASTGTPAAPTTDPGTVASLAEISAALTVQPVDSTICTDLARKHGVKTLKTDYGEILPVKLGVKQTGKKYSAAMGTLLYGATAQEKVDALELKYCQDPFLGSAHANMFANLKVGDVSVLKNNTWLKDFKSLKSANAQARHYVLYTNSKSSDEEIKAAAKRQYEWQQIAGTMITLEREFKVEGIKSPTSVINWERTVGSSVGVKHFPKFKRANEQEDRPAVILTFRLKSGTCLAKVGANTKDSRPEVFRCGKYTPKVPHKTTTPHTGTCTSNCGGTTPKCTPPWYSGTPGYTTGCHPKKLNNYRNPGTRDPVDHNPGTHTGGTPGAGTGTSSPSDGGTGTAPSGGGSDGSGGTTPTNDPDDQHQGGSGNGDTGVTDPG